MKQLYTLLVITAVGLSTAASQILPSAVPTKNLKGHWTFDNSSAPFVAAVGIDVIKDKSASATESITSIDGPIAGNKALHVPKFNFLHATPGLSANGISDTLKKVNRYSMVIDFRITNRGEWRTFYQTDPANANDGDLFIRNAISTRGHNIGRATPGYSFDSITVGRWYRLVIVANIGAEFNLYLDGNLLLKGSPMTADNNQALESVDGLDELLFFGDDDGDNGEIDVAEIALYDTTLTLAQISSMGGYGYLVQAKDPVNTFDMTDVANVLKPTTGIGTLALKGSGALKVVAGPKPGLNAVQLQSGQYLQLNHSIVANGMEANGRTNRWSVLVDFKLPELTQAYDLLQTDTTNLSPAELVITDAGKAGCDTLGYSDSVVVAAKKWHRAIMSVEGGKIASYYMDGKKVSQKSILPSGRFTLVPAANGKLGALLIGSQTDGNHTNLIEIAQVQVWNRWIDSSTASTVGAVDVFSDLGTGKGGSSVMMDGTDANMYVRLPSKPQYTFDSTKSFTVEAWIKPLRLWDGDPAIISNKDWGAGSNAGWAIALDAGGVWQYNIGDGGINTDAKHRADIDNIAVINDEQWHHIAVVVDRSSNFARAYSDGVLKKSADISAVKNIDTDYDLNIGQDGTGNYSWGFYYGGYIDEVRIWGAALDSATLKAWMFGSSTINNHPQFSELRGYWRFDTVAGDSTPDASSYATWGILKNGASLRRSDVALPVRKAESVLPNSFALDNAFPNPFNPSTTIRFSVPFNSNISLNVFNVLGQHIATLFNGEIQAGTYHTVWNASTSVLPVASGVYFYRFDAVGLNNEHFTETKKLLFMK
ncbi:MAG: LamG-like jellyroll fold domain-containing protein [Bacteriovoracaceae bacterium]|nr:T9SS type A sorting domain-containing protein [Bacteroidota bacterium]